MVLRLYLDLMSQPSRALALFVRMNSIPCEEVAIAIRKSEHLTDNYATINPFMRVPALDHDGFKLAESPAMLTYLCRTFPVPNNWYPLQDTKKMASIDSYMSWQHLNLRSYGTQLFRSFLASVTTGKPEDARKKAAYEEGLRIVLSQIESIWLKNHPYIASDELSIADLLAVTELEQPGLAGFDVRNGYSRINEYMELVKSNLNPHYDEVHSIVYKIKGKLQQLQKGLKS